MLSPPLIYAALMMLAAEPARQPAPGSDAELEALIPQAAVDDPESWAKVPASEAQPLPNPSAPLPPNELDPSSPMASDADFRLPWPDEALALPELVSLEPDPDLAHRLPGRPKVR